MIASVAWTFQIASAPWPCWKMKTMIPNARGQRDQVQDHRLERQQDRAERPHQQHERQQDHEGEHVGELPVDGVDEVAVLGSDAARASPGTCRRTRARAPAARRAAGWRSSLARTSPRRPRTGTPRRARRLRRQSCRAARRHRRCPASARALDHRPQRVGSGLCSTSTTYGLIAPGEIPAAVERVESDHGVAGLRRRRGPSAWASAGLSCRPGRAGAPTIAMPTARDRDRPAHDEVRPAPPEARLAVAALDDPLRHHPQPS